MLLFWLRARVVSRLRRCCEGVWEEERGGGATLAEELLTAEQAAALLHRWRCARWNCRGSYGLARFMLVRAYCSEL